MGDKKSNAKGACSHLIFIALIFCLPIVWAGCADKGLEQQLKADLNRQFGMIREKLVDTNILQEADCFLANISTNSASQETVLAFTDRLLKSARQNLHSWSMKDDDVNVDQRYNRMRKHYGEGRYMRIREFYLSRLNAADELERTLSAVALVRGLCDKFVSGYLIEKLSKDSDLSESEALTYADLVSRLHDGRCQQFLQKTYTNEAARTGFRVLAAKALIRIGKASFVVSNDAFRKGPKSFTYHILDSLPFEYWRNEKVVNLAADWMFKLIRTSGELSTDDRLLLGLLAHNLPGDYHVQASQEKLRELDDFAQRLVCDKDPSISLIGGHLAYFSISDSSAGAWMAHLGKISDEYANALILGAVYQHCSPTVIRRFASLIRPMLNSENSRVRDAAFAVLVRSLGRRYRRTYDINVFSNNLQKVIKEVFGE